MDSPPAQTAPEAFGNYTILEQLGAGGMATVCRAVQGGIEGFQRTVALKRLLPELVNDEDFVKAFVREARIASHLRHMNCAQTYDLGKVGNTYYIAMELVEGPDLRKLLRHTATVTGPMPVPLIVNLLTQLCDALDYAHTLCDETGTPMGIIHRDVSPANIIVAARDGTAKLIDFGIAKASSANLATQSGLLKGKFAYMAPENLTGNIDARADLFAIGVMAHELLTARPLFAGSDDDFETLKRVRSMPIVTPSDINRDVPEDLDSIVLTALARNPDERWQSAAAMRSSLIELARLPAMQSARQDIAKWMEWAFQQKAGGPKPVAPGRRRDPNETDSPAISMDSYATTADPSPVSLPVPSASNTTPGVVAPARTLMGGAGAPAPRTTGSQMAQRPSAQMAVPTPAAVVPSSRATPRTGLAATVPRTTGTMKAPPPVAAGTPHQVAAAFPSSAPTAPVRRTEQQWAPPAPASAPPAPAPPAPVQAAPGPQASLPTAPVKVQRPGMPMMVILLICLGAAGISFALVFLLT